MQRIVINNCIGGFDLSHKATMRYAELKGIKLWAWLSDEWKETFGDKTIEEAGEVNDWSIDYATVPVHSDTEFKEQSKRFSGNISFNPSAIKRDDPYLIQTVEELGEEANGIYANLKAVEIPDDVKWIIVIDEMGYEYIAENTELGIKKGEQ